MENEMRSISEDLRLCLQELRRNIFVLCLLTLFGLIVGAAGSLLVKETAVYQARACIYNAKYASYYEATAVEHFLQNTQTLVGSYKIAKNTVELLGDTSITIQEVQSSVYAETQEESVVVWLVAESYSPQRALQIVNAFTEALTAEMKTITSTDNIQVLEYANSSSMEHDPAMVRILIIAMVPIAFLMVGCVVFCLRMLLSNRVLSLDRCTLNGQINLLGVIPEIPKEEGKKTGQRK